MDQAISRSRGKVAGVLVIVLILNGIINFLGYFVQVVPNSGIPVPNLIRNLVMLSALTVFVIQAMRNKSGVLLFVAATVFVAAFLWFTVPMIIKGTAKPGVQTYCMMLSLACLILVAAFSAFNLDRVVRYTWYLPSLTGLAFVLIYYARTFEIHFSLISGSSSFAELIYRLTNLSVLPLRPVVYLYLGLWLKSLADEHLRRGSYRF